MIGGGINKIRTKSGMRRVHHIQQIDVIDSYRRHLRRRFHQLELEHQHLHGANRDLEDTLRKVQVFLSGQSMRVGVVQNMFEGELPALSETISKVGLDDPSYSKCTESES